ncbi:S-adenosyl-L-methionine-dependent methyltransferase [Ochromonadaceae sp. CCMP2298]|nr:S-adenosyl-L-methionine-dependent methyltransferase [Ochromonadaceae sp. CCMP2298]
MITRHLQRFANPIRAMSTSAVADAAKGRSTAASGSQVYEGKRAVFEYLLFHYGRREDHFPYGLGAQDALDFPARCAKVCSEHGTSGKKRALDIGCAVGGQTFELARHYDEVVGIDFSQHFIDAAEEMKASGKMPFEALVRGEVFKTCEAVVDTTIDRTRATFQQGDACSMPASLGTFDVILASNLLCRLPNPRKFLADVPQFLNPGGCLVLVSPFSWLEEYTPLSEWMGATSASPDSAAEVAAFMEGKGMQLVHRADMPFLIREHERKFQYGVSDCTVWRKN